MSSWFGGSSTVSGSGSSNAGGDAAKSLNTEIAREDVYSGAEAQGRTVTYDGAPVNYNLRSTMGRGVDLSKVMKQPTYLETDMNSGRDAYSRMFYHTGAAYGTTLIFGSLYGGLVGLRNSPSRRWKIRLNSVLNEASNRGARISNSVGVLALMYSLAKSGIEYTTVNDQLALGDWADSVLAAGITGMIYKFPRGPQHMALFATGGAALMGSAVVLSKQLAQRGMRMSTSSLFARH